MDSSSNSSFTQSRDTPSSLKSLLNTEKRLPPSLRDSPALKPLVNAKDPFFGGKMLHSSSAPNLSVNHRNIQRRYEDNTLLSAPAPLKLRNINKTKGFPGQLRKTQLQLEREQDEAEALAVKQAAAAEAAVAAAAGVLDPSLEQSLKASDAFLSIDQSKLPLWLFDNASLDPKTPEEWVETGSAAKSPYFVSAKIGWQWKPCKVLRYDRTQDKDDQQWRVVSAGEQVDGRYEIQFRGQSKPKMVKRINLCFDQEDQACFHKRIEAAEASREDAKARLRYDFYIDGQETSQLRPMQPQTLKGIHEKMIDGLIPTTRQLLEDEQVRSANWEDGDVPLVLSALFQELVKNVIDSYTRAMKKEVAVFTRC